MPTQENDVNTSGGAYIGGNVSAGVFVGRDLVETTIHADNLQIHLTKKDEPLTSLNYAALISEVEQLIETGDFDVACEIAKKIPLDIKLSGRAKFLQAVSILRGRSFNALSPKDRIDIEKCLVFAYKKLDNNLEVLIFLTVLEIDYYNYHGQESENEITPELVTSRLRLDASSNKDFKFLKFLKMSKEAKDLLEFR